ncbi:ferredoxin-type protein NapF [Vibrio sp. V27_P1S3P104]|uniref:ferredoxin-type protein NapF n=1 Tax=unclassified Vibrio TaxID=2614977 RepID=UPI001372AC63|nr:MULTISPECIES: ferredoxin-type protein NapF [unclassified Vibrio]NAW69976.1 ferredoxin-type protein NapF [Vibrio sp. V28_P6S34P95]NAX03709.1 ferredoxin-type protein NapF [Vibrio sp. V30_P3S12P165]NAX35062.1 ferredoxin-type protein NapF [Vibrio sp. V29_P1S30P107]NAX36325.1 ferredoxin-type protein NapF [Vibrio sp. V27_P1S3P104]NAX41317.1 ferredoxin-type protein NapF [Vibrio sp. V26_P1S5P106]
MSDAPRNVSRRDLFRNMLARGKSAYQEADHLPKRTIPRPPGALAEGLFREVCDGCGLCAEACPNSVIQCHDQWPELCVDYHHCQLCGECAKACPTGALQPATQTELLPTFSHACQSRLFGYCELCVEQCPSQAIQCLPDQKPTVDSALCNGCGQCRAACPASAISWNIRV